MSVIRVNGRDLADFELALRRLEGWLDRSDSARARVPWIGRAGEWVSRQEIGSPRSIELVSWTENATVEARDAMLATLRELLMPGTRLEVVFGDQPTKRLLAYFTRERVEGIAPRRPFAVAPVELDQLLTAFQSVKIDAVPTFGALAAGGGTRVPVGTAPSYGTIFLRGPSVDPEIVLRSFRGQERGGIVFDGAIDGTETWKIDLALRAVWRIDSTGTETPSETDVEEWTDDFTFRPSFANRLLGQLPYITLSTGAGVIVTRRHWLT